MMAQREGQNSPLLGVFLTEWAGSRRPLPPIKGIVHADLLGPITYAFAKVGIADRKCEQGDEVHVTLPTHTEAALLPDQSPWVSFLHGPIVLAAATDTTDLAGMFADDSRMGQAAEGKLYPIDEAPVLVSDGENLAQAI